MIFLKKQYLTSILSCLMLLTFNVSTVLSFCPIPDPPCDPSATFCNQADAAGLHIGGSAYGRGAAALDIDNDGDIDVFQVDSGSKRIDHAYQSRIHLNNGDGTFTTIDPAVWGISANHLLSNWQALFFDADNDGDSDLLLVNGGYNDDPEQLFFYQNELNTTGLFTDISASAGFTSDFELYWGATAADFDNDGLLDVVITSRNFYTYEPDNPGMIPGDLTNALLVYRNTGNNQFTEISELAGLPNPVGDNKNPIVLDYNQDGWMDFLITKWEHDSSRIPYLGGGVKLFKNEGDGMNFTEIDLGLSDQILPGETRPEYLAFAAAVIDYNQDGWQDIYLGRWDMQDYILHNEGDGTFTKLSTSIGLDALIGGGTPYENTMGLTVYDIFNNDGYPDIVIGPGNPSTAGLPLVYCSNGGSNSFNRCSDDFVAGHGISRNHGVCMADFDDDGDVDIFWNLGGFAGYGNGELDNNGDPFWAPTDEYPAYYVNQSSTGTAYPIAYIKLTGTISNREGIGAKIHYSFINTSGNTEHRYSWRQSADGFMSQNSEWLPISLEGANPTTATVEVIWPSGLQSTNIVVNVGNKLEIVEPSLLQVNLLLEGAYDTGSNMMNPPIFGNVPLTHPYMIAPWNYIGTENVLTTNNDIVTWVMVEARAANDSNLLIDSRVGLLRQDGVILDPMTHRLETGIGFPKLSIGESYYFVVRHQNHIDVLTANTYPYEGTTLIDFTTDINLVAGTNQLVALGTSGFYGLSAGDFNGDGTITVQDFNIFQCQGAMFSNGLAADANLDGTVSVSDFNFYFANVSKIGVSEIRYPLGLVLLDCP